MTFTKLRKYLPRSLFGRALLILVLPIILIQFTVGGIFADRIFNDMTRIMSTNFAPVINEAISDFASAEDRVEAQTRAARLGIDLSEVPVLPDQIRARAFYDFAGFYVEQNMKDLIDDIVLIEIPSRSSSLISLWVQTDDQITLAKFHRRFVSARNPHQLPVIMVLTSLLLTAVAVLFLRNQITPIRRLADAAEAFGQGRNLPLRPRGSTEIRQAATSFLDMRSRIERHIDQRTLMLSGVSHDLRTPLTRLKLGLSMLEAGETERKEMIGDITDMENIIDEFLIFAGEDQDSGQETVQINSALEMIMDRCRRGFTDPDHLTFTSDLSDELQTSWRSTAIQRAVENLIENASKYGTRVAVSASSHAGRLRISIEDDGPGIPADQRSAATNAFVRLDQSRNQNKGGSAGLGLAITQDILRSHGGKLILRDSAALGGLNAIIDLPIVATENGRPGGT